MDIQCEISFILTCNHLLIISFAFRKILPPISFESHDLYRHLKRNDETRFHAMYLFSRYVMRVADCRRDAYTETSSMRRVRRELLWDVAFCCLAISIKVSKLTKDPMSIP